MYALSKNSIIFVKSNSQITNYANFKSVFYEPKNDS